MKKITIFGLLFLSLLMPCLLIFSSDRADTNDFIIVNTRFRNRPRIFTDNIVQTSLYKNNQEIEGFTLLSNTIFQVEKGDYILKSEFENQHFEQNVHKSDNIPENVTFNFEMNGKIRFFELFSRTATFILLLMNVLIYMKSDKIVKRKSPLIIITFLLLLFNNFLSFTNIFPQKLLFVSAGITTIALTISFILCFFYLVSSKERKYWKYIFIFAIMTYFSLINILFLVSPNILMYLVKFHINTLITSINIYVVLAYFVDYMILFVPLFCLLRGLQKNKDKDLKNMKILQILFLLLFLILNIATEFSNSDIFFNGDILENMQYSIIFWILFFNLNIDDTAKYYISMQRWVTLVLKYIVIINIIYIIGIESSQYRFTFWVIIFCIIGDIIYLLVIRLMNRLNPRYDQILAKLKGIDDIHIFENILEKEISKKINPKTIKFIIFLSDTEEKEYIRNKSRKIIISKEDFKNKYANFDFGIKISVGTNTCIALLLIELNERKYHNEEKLFLKGLSEELVYSVNYVRTLHLRKYIESVSDNKYINEEIKENIQFIKDFAALIYNLSDDKKIKAYSKTIIEKAEKLGDKHD
ncbi:hypothetical protein [Sebaldella sp. S0638]|uniref:hypothetical protein n=1 Tax=Sebaldella sp. S0638 TaxID=2957809 RepID=UPI00209FCFE5|nr:hypothetical protein [Sebaldella sp. S0638]MCP1223009.1 hypothetical protein [Sebaldella sp. S0638]